MEKKYNFELIRDYLHGVLNKKTAEEIGALIRTDETARSIALGIVQLEKTFASETEADEYLDGFQQKQLELIGNPKSRSGFSVRSIVKIAASLLLLISAGFVVYWLSTPNMEDLLERELSMAYAVPTLARGTDESTIDQAYQLYLQKDYKQAAEQFQLVWQQDPNQPAALFYGGLSFLYAGDHHAALNLLQQPSLMSSRFEQQARWYSALALIRSGKTDKAIAMLNEIVFDGSHFKAAEAKEFLEILSNL